MYISLILSFKRVLLLPLFCGREAKEQGYNFVLHVFKILSLLLNIWIFFFLTVGPPKITQHPKNQTVPPGADTTFTVEATGDYLQFRWQKNRMDIDSNDSRFSSIQTDGASTLRILHVEESDKGHYRCLVKNPVEQSGISSQEAKLAVGKFVVP